ncbi:MAG: DUF2807 domain-containing protein [Treponema sp.]|nr:DUF2807 domain-containing protein [Treponema sp.]
MKKFNVIAMSFIIMVFVSCNSFHIAGNGDLATSERAVTSFQKISTGSSVEICFYKSSEYKVVITTDSNLMEYVISEIKNNTLYIGLRNGSYSFTKIMADVYCPVLTSVSISGSGKFSSNEKIAVPEFELIISGSGKADGEIDCDILNAVISGSGVINISGNNKNSNINVSGSGKFNGLDFIINEAVVNVSGSGDLNIHVTESLKAVISGSGILNYRGDPQVDKNINGSGKINKL